IVLVPDRNAARIVPLDPFAVIRVAPILILWKRAAGSVPELASAVIAIADTLASESAPTVIGETFGMAALDDFPHDVRHVFIVIAAVDASDVFVIGPVWVA